MNTETINKNGNITLIPGGRLDSLSSESFENAVEDSIKEEINSLTIDMKNVDFVSSRGLRILVSAYKKLGEKDLHIENVNSAVMEVLRISGLLRIFKVNENDQ